MSPAAARLRTGGSGGFCSLPGASCTRFGSFHLNKLLLHAASTYLCVYTRTRARTRTHGAQAVKPHSSFAPVLSNLVPCLSVWKSNTKTGFYNPSQPKRVPKPERRQQPAALITWEIGKARTRCRRRRSPRSRASSGIALEPRRQQRPRCPNHGDPNKRLSLYKLISGQHVATA